MSPLAWVVDALIASSLLLAAVLLVRKPVRRAFGAQLAYALWALPVLRLLMPPLPAGWWRASAAAPITRAGESVTVYIVEPLVAASGAASEASTGVALGLVLAALWAIGAALFLGWHLVRHYRFCRAVLRDAAPLDECDGIRIIASAQVPGPLAFGVARRFVAFPADFAARYDADEAALALKHEIGHHRRRDLLANWVALAVLALHWFNPIAWAAFRAFRADQELANDAGVLAGCAPGDAHAYGRAIVKAVSPKFAGMTACHLRSVDDLKGRLRMLKVSRASRRRIVAGSASVTVLVAAGLGLTASSSAAERVAATLETPAPVSAAAAVAAVAQVAPTPPTPPAPVTRPRQRRHLVVVRDGETRTYEGADADRYIADHHLPVPPVPPTPSVVLPPPGVPMVAPVPPAPPGAPVITMRRFQRDGGDRSWTMVVPQVSNGRCPGDATRPVVEHRTERGQQRIVICQNRIEAMERSAQIDAVRAEAMARGARQSARVNLAMAKSAIERDRNLSTEQRSEALEGIAQAEAELRAERD